MQTTLLQLSRTSAKDEIARAQHEHCRQANNVLEAALACGVMYIRPLHGSGPSHIPYGMESPSESLGLCLCYVLQQEFIFSLDGNLSLHALRVNRHAGAYCGPHHHSNFPHLGRLAGAQQLYFHFASFPVNHTWEAPFVFPLCGHLSMQQSYLSGSYSLEHKVIRQRLSHDSSFRKDRSVTFCQFS